MWKLKNILEHVAAQVLSSLISEESVFVSVQVVVDLRERALLLCAEKRLFRECHVILCQGGIISEPEEPF